MATDLHPAKPAPAAKKYETFVARQLARARARIRWLDLAAAGLGWLILTLVYSLVLALCDRWLELSSLTRQIAFALYAAGSCVYLALLVLRPLLRPINPYYAARRLERTIPEAKNSVVNWLDLHEQALASAFRNAISEQAARDLADADLEQAISARRASWLGLGATALFLGMLILFVLGPRQFLSLLNRAFAPFIEAPIATRTYIQLERPEGGDVTIPIGRAVSFSVWVEGRVPESSSSEALRLLYRYNRSDPYQSRLLEPGDSSRQWVTNLLAPEVHNGFWYKVAGGDAETAEYRVQVRSTPLLTGFDVTYHYRPYLGWPDRTTHDQNLQDLRGTEVTLLARTNRTVKDGELGIEGQKNAIAGELVPEDPQALRFRLRLEKDGSYRIRFQSVEDERNLDPMPYTIRVLQDHPPQVELAKPGEDIELPANGVLHLKGSASDDFGIASLNLRMKLENGAKLQAKPYRKGEALRRGDGSYPQVLAYQDFVELDKLPREEGKPVEPLPVGAKLEYWLEATDNCDYPGPNIGESKHFTVTIRAADTDPKKQQQQRQDARQQQQQHEQKQDQELQKQKREPRDTPQEQQPRPSDADSQGKEGGTQNEQALNQQKEKIENAIKKNEQQQKADGKGEGQRDQSQQSQGDGKGEARSENQKDNAQNQPKEGGEGKPQPGQEKRSDKPEKQQQDGAGQGAPQSEGNRQNQGGQQGTQRQTDPGKTEGNKERSEPAANQNNGANQAGQNTQSRPQPSGDKQPQDQATPQKGQEKPGANAGKTQEKNQDRQEGGNPSGTNRKPDGQPEKVEKKGPGQEGAKQETGQAKGEPKQGGDAGKVPEKNQGQPQGGDQSGTNRKPDGQAEKTEKKGPGQEGAKQETGQAKGEPKQGADAEKVPKPNPNQQTGAQQGSPKKDDGHPGRPKEGSEGERQAGQQANPQRKDPADGAEGSSSKPNAAGKENANGGAREDATKAQEKSTGPDKGEAGNRGAAKPEQKENRQNPATQGAQRAENSPEQRKSEQGNGRTDREPQPKPEHSGATPSGEKSKDDVSALSKALTSRDEKTRSEARKRLEELRDKAQDPSARRAAAEALKQAGQENAGKPEQKRDLSSPSAGKEPSETEAAAKSNQSGTGQGKEKAGNQKPTTPKGEDEKTGPSDPGKGEPKPNEKSKGQGDSESATGERGNQPASSKKPGGSGAAGRTGGNEPTAQQPDPRRSPDDRPNREPEPEEPATPPNAAYQKRAGEMQLEDIKKKINKDVLRELNMTEEDFQKFAKAYEEMLKRKQPAAEKENLAAPQRGNRALPNQDLRLVDPREQAKEGKLQRLGPAAVPPEFRDAYKEFSRRISELEKSKEKK